MDQSLVSTNGAYIVLLFLFSILFSLGLMTWLGWKKEGIRGSLCPYTQSRLRLGTDIARSIQVLVNSFIEDLDPKDNPPIDFSKAAISEMTGRIYPDCVGANERISLDWSFLQKRFPGTFISWGSLPENEKAVFKLLHGNLDGFQTEVSSPRIRPEDVEREYALQTPGPLYVDRVNRILLGWKKVPGTYFEVLIVQRPIYRNIDETL